MASPTRQATALALKESLNDVVVQLGADLEEVDVSAAGRRTRIRIVVDADGGVDLDAIAAISQAVSAALDDPLCAGPALEAFASGPYTLEVTSPGVDRPLTLPRHWRRNVSRLVEITLADSATGVDSETGADSGTGRSFVGRITGATDTQAMIEVDGQVHDVPLAAVAHAVVRIEFRRPDEGR